MFQGGDSVELLGTSGKDPAAQWKLVGKVRREYDKSCKGYLYTMEGSALATKMSLPKDNGKPLGLTQRYLIIQVWLPQAKAISIEVGVTDTNGARRRVVISSAFRGAVVHPLHAQIPLLCVTRETWLNWCFDIGGLVNGSFGQSSNLRTIDAIYISGSCKLRRVFTMKEPPIPSDHPFDYTGGVEIPRAFAMTPSVTEYFAAKNPREAIPEKSKVVVDATQSKRPSKGQEGMKARPHSSTTTTKPIGAATSSTSTGKKTNRPATTPNTKANGDPQRPVTPLAATKLSEHSKHIQSRLEKKIQPIKPISTLTPSIFQFSTLLPSNEPTRIETKTRRLESKFQSWEDDLSPPKPKVVAKATPLMSPHEHVESDMVTPQLAKYHEDIPTTPSEVTALLAKELSLDLPSSPFFQFTSERNSPNEDSSKSFIGATHSKLGDLFQEQNDIENNQVDQVLVNAIVEKVSDVDTSSVFSKWSPIASNDIDKRLFQWSPTRKDSRVDIHTTELKLLPENQAATSDQLQELPEAQDNSHLPQVDDDNDDDISFDITNDLEEKSFDFTDELEESLPSMVQIQRSPTRKQPSPKSHAKTSQSLICNSIDGMNLHPRLKSLLESTGILFILNHDHCLLDWSQEPTPTVELVYDPILHCYLDPMTNKYYQLK